MQCVSCVERQAAGPLQGRLQDQDRCGAGADLEGGDPGSDAIWRVRAAARRSFSPEGAARGEGLRLSSSGAAARSGHMRPRVGGGGTERKVSR